MVKEDKVCHYLQEGMVALLPGCREGDGNGDREGDRDGGTQVFTLRGAYRDPRSLPWLVELLARFYRLDLATVRRQTGRLLGLSHHIPLPLAEGLVLLPVKVRQASALGENTNGYVNLLQVENVDAVGGGSGNGGSGKMVNGANGEKGENGNNGENGERSEVHGGSLGGARPISGEQTKTLYAAGYAAGNHALFRSRIICRGGLVICCLNTAATVKAKLRQGETAYQDLLQRQRLTSGPAAPFAGLKDKGLRELLPSCDCLLRNFFLLLLECASHVELKQRQRQAPAPAASAGAGKK